MNLRDYGGLGPGLNTHTISDAAKYAEARAPICHQPSEREREIAGRFINRIGPGSDWTEAIAGMLADYRAEFIKTIRAEAADDLARFIAREWLAK